MSTRGERPDSSETMRSMPQQQGNPPAPATGAAGTGGSPMPRDTTAAQTPGSTIPGTGTSAGGTGSAGSSSAMSGTSMGTGGTTTGSMGGTNRATGGAGNMSGTAPTSNPGGAGATTGMSGGGMSGTASRPGSAANVGSTSAGAGGSSSTGSGAMQGQSQTPSSMPDAGQVKDQVADKVQDVKAQAQQQVGQVADQAKQQATTLLGGQKDRAAEAVTGIAQALRSTGNQLRQNDQGSVAQYTDKLAERVEAFSGSLSGKDVNELVADVERYARKQPAVFLGGAFVLGVLAARFLKSSGENANNDASGQGSQYSQSAAARQSANSDDWYERTYGRTGGRRVTYTSGAADHARRNTEMQ